VDCNINHLLLILHHTLIYERLIVERRELWSDLYNKFKNDYSAEKDTEKLTEEEVLEQMHGSPELKGLDEYIASFCALGNKSQSQEIVN